MEQTHEIKLAFTRQEDGMCNVFVDKFALNPDDKHFTAKRAEFIFVPVKLYEPDSGEKTFLNIPFEELKRFAEEVLKES